MTRWTLASVALAAMLAMLADGAANAQQSGKRSAARSSHTGGINAAMSDGSVRFVQPGLGSGRRTNSGPQKAGKALTGAGPSKGSPTLFLKRKGAKSSQLFRYSLEIHPD